MSFLKSLLIIFIFFLNFTVAYSKDNIAFIDLDLILKNSNFGKLLLNQFDSDNLKNIEKLKIKEKELKKIEDEIKKKKNIISKEELEKELLILKDKITEFNKIKGQLVLEFENKRNKEINEFFLKINPIIQNYMNENSIDILLERKNVFIGKNDSDITNIIIKQINNTLK